MKATEPGYASYKEAMLTKKSVIEFTAVSINSFQNISELRKKPFWPLINCICVQDSPDNPCPCNHNIIIWWPTKDILDIKKTSNKSPEGQDIFKVTADINTEAQIEITIPVSAKKIFGGKHGSKCNCEKPATGATTQRRNDAFARFCKNLNPDPLDIGWYTMCDCIAETDNSTFKCIADYIDDKRGI